MNALKSLCFGWSWGVVLAPITVGTACTTQSDTTPTNTTPDAALPGPSTSADAAATDSGPGPGPGPGPRTDGVVREIAYHSITTKEEHRPAVKPALSRNGSRVVWSVYPSDTKSQIFVADATGTEPKLVDTHPQASGSYALVAISDDGGTVASIGGKSIRVADANTGMLKGELVFSSGEVSSVSLNGGGTEVYLVLRRDDAFAATPGVPLQRGLYKWAPGTTTITPLATAATVAPLVSLPVANVFPFSACGGGGGFTALTNSTDGSKIYAALQVNDAMLVIQTSNAGGTPKVIVPAITDSYKFVNGIATNGDGSKLAFDVSNTSTLGSQIEIINADGTGRKKIADVSGGCGTPLTLADDGNRIAHGKTGRLYHADGTDSIALLSPTGATGYTSYLIGEPSSGESQALLLSADGKRFAYLHNEFGGNAPYHVIVGEIDSRSLGATPTVSEPKVSQASVTRQPQTFATLSAKVSGTNVFVGNTVFDKGFEAGAYYTKLPLYDDGKLKDTAAGDGVYTSDEKFGAEPTQAAGSRIIRIKAELKDTATGKRHAHAVDFGPFSVQ